MTTISICLVIKRDGWKKKVLVTAPRPIAEDLIPSLVITAKPLLNAVRNELTHPARIQAGHD